MKDSAEMDVLAGVAHGAAAVLNVLGIAYNWRRSRRVDFDVVVHGVSLAYHLGCVVKHYRRAESYL